MVHLRCVFTCDTPNCGAFVQFNEPAMNTWDPNGRRAELLELGWTTLGAADFCPSHGCPGCADGGKAHLCGKPTSGKG